MNEELEQLFDQHWKGFRSYDELTMEEKRTTKYEYSAEDFHDALKHAYNLGIQIVAEYVERESPIENESSYEFCAIDKTSVLNLKIK